MESTSAKVDLYKDSKVKLPMAELDYLKPLSQQIRKYLDQRSSQCQMRVSINCRQFGFLPVTCNFFARKRLQKCSVSSWVAMWSPFPDLRTLEDARDFMTTMVKKTSENRQELAAA